MTRAGQTARCPEEMFTGTCSSLLYTILLLLFWHRLLLAKQIPTLHPAGVDRPTVLFDLFTPCLKKLL
jgi:hypothetical protein